VLPKSPAAFGKTGRRRRIHVRALPRVVA
jgi:hypothetical protein